MNAPRTLIVGGGPAGCAAAITLARAGRPALLVERSTGPHDTVCGGFLGWDALEALSRLGMPAAKLGARPITRLRICAAGSTLESALPHPAAGLSRRLLDEALLAAAASAGAEVQRGRSVRAADPEALSIRLDDGETLDGDALLLATGKHELRGAGRSCDTRDRPVGIRTALEPSAALRKQLEGVIELHLFDGGYGGLLLQENGRANLALSVSRERFRRSGGIEPLLAELGAELPELGRRLDQGAASDWSAISGVPYGWRATATGPGLYRIGDQAAVIASLAGDGIAIALASGIAAAEALIEGRTAPSFQKLFSRRAATPVAVAERLRWAAEHRLARKPMMKVLAAAPFLPGFAARLTRIGA